MTIPFAGTLILTLSASCCVSEAASAPTRQSASDPTDSSPSVIRLVQPHVVYTVNGKPVLGTYGALSIDELALVRDVGMNVVIGGQQLLDVKSPTGKYCLENGIKVILHMTHHLYGKPRLADAVSPDATTLPLLDGGAHGIPKSGVVQIGDELIQYERATPTELRGCQRGIAGTTAEGHHGGTILFFPEPCEAEVKRVKDSPNLWGYYVLDDSPGDALSALRAMYRTIRREDPNPAHHPVCAGYGSAGSLCNFAPGVCDIMLIYWYPVSSSGYDRYMTSHEVQWMLTSARARAPGVPFIGVYQAFDGGTGVSAMPTAAQLREQMADFVREGASGLIAFICRSGWAKHPYMQKTIRGAHREILRTGGLSVAPQPDKMRGERIQPVGQWESPREVPGVVPAWHVIGPFEDSQQTRLEAVNPPERAVDLRGVYEGQRGPVRWVRRRSHGGVVGLGELVGFERDNAVAYAFCTVTSPRSQRVQMRLGSDDDAIVWVNEQEAWRYEGTRGLHRDDDIVEITLAAGTTPILVKVCNRAGMWGFFMRFTDAQGRPLEGLTFSPDTAR